jgi:hypothetical protein
MPPKKKQENVEDQRMQSGLTCVTVTFDVAGIHDVKLVEI